MNEAKAPVVVGDAIAPRRLTDFGSELRQDPSNLPLPGYAPNGIVDELRISNVARTEFESAEGREGGSRHGGGGPSPSWTWRPAGRSR